MARRPSVFVRPLSMDEGRKLQKITRTAKNPVLMRPATVVMMFGPGPDLPRPRPATGDIHQWSVPCVRRESSAVCHLSSASRQPRP